MEYNSPEGFAYLLKTFFGYVWQFFQFEMPFFHIPFSDFIIGFAAASFMVRVVVFLIGYYRETPSGGGRGNKYHLYGDEE